MIARPIIAVLALGTLLSVFLNTKADRDYDVKLAGMDIASNAEDMVDDCALQVNAVNDTFNVFSGDCTLVQPLPDTTFVTMQGFEQARDNNGYEEDPTIDKSGNLCDFLENDTTFLPDLRKYSNIPEKCPFELKKYTFNDFPCDSESLPSHMPGRTNWRFDVTMWLDDSKTVKITSASAFMQFPLKNQQG